MTEPNYDIVAAKHTLALLTGEADGLRKELVRLRRDVRSARRDLAGFQRNPGSFESNSNDPQPTQLREADEQLVLAAMRAENLVVVGKNATQTFLSEMLAQSAALKEGVRVGNVKQESILHDLREANEQLVLAALTAQKHEIEAEAAHDKQLQLMATVAHELRNPLSPIRTAASMLTLARTDEVLHTRLQLIIERQVVHMSRLIDDLLDESRINTGKLRLERRLLELADILDIAVDACRPGIDAKQQYFQLTLPGGPLCLDGDPVRMAQVFSNLLDNASKYTPDGGEIKLVVSEVDKELIITLSDNGVGIDAEILPHIFDLFVQDPLGLTVHRGGLGIGLSIVRDLIEAHGGTVVAHSAGRNCGSEFVITLPMVDADNMFAGS